MERRKERRFNVEKRALVRILAAVPGHDLGQPLDAMIVDFSGNGMQLRLPDPVPVGAAVEIIGDNNFIRGTVCHCEPQDAAYLVGVQILEYVVPPRMEYDLR